MSFVVTYLCKSASVPVRKVPQRCCCCLAQRGSAAAECQQQQRQVLGWGHGARCKQNELLCKQHLFELRTRGSESAQSVCTSSKGAVTGEGAAAAVVASSACCCCCSC